MIAYEHNQVNYHLPMMHWLMNLSQLLQNLSETKSARLMQAKLESIYMQDALTGLYNRHGFEYRIRQLLSDTPEGTRLTAVYFDMDSLKQMNDSFGQAEGDLALQTVAHSLRRAVSGDASAICTRFGRGEFGILSNRLDQEGTDSLLEQVRQYLTNYNHLSSKPYRLSVSCSYAALACRANMGAADIERLFIEAKTNLSQSRAR